MTNLLVTAVVSSSSGTSQLGALNTTSAATTEWGGKGEVDVLLGLTTNNEGGNVDGLLTNADVTLADQNTSVVDGLSETQLENLGLETTLKEIADGEGENIIELGLGLVQNTDALEATDEGGTFEHTTGILLVKSEELTSSGTDLGEEELNAPNLVLALEAILTAELELGVETLLLKGRRGRVLVLRWFLKAEVCGIACV